MDDPLILCATDLTAEGARAVDLAIAAAKAIGGRLHLAHATGPEVLDEEVPEGVTAAVDTLKDRIRARTEAAQAKLDAERVRAETAGVATTAALCGGATPAEAILSAAEELRPSMLVLGRRHREAGFVGMTVDQVCRRGPCPVFVAPPEGEAPSSFDHAKWLVGADLSPHGLRAMHAAQALSHRVGGELEVVHVAPPSGAEGHPYIEQTPQVVLREQSLQEREASLAALVAAEFPGATSRQVRSIERPSQVLDEIAREIGATAIVVGTHGRSGLSRLFLGSTAERLLRCSHCPVLVVRDAPDAASPLYEVPAESPPESLTPSRILVATDFSRPARKAAEMARDLAATLSAEVVLLHVFDAPSDVRRGIAGRALDAGVAHDVPKEAELALDKALTAEAAAVFGDDHGEIETILRAGRPLEQIVGAVRDNGIDLLVVGTTGRTGLSALLLGSVSEKLVRECPVPVLTVQ